MRIGPGPSERACSGVHIGQMRCTSWVRTDIARMRPAVPFGYGPSDLQTAYSLTGPSSTDGIGQTVIVVDAYDDLNAEADLGVYRTTFALPACTTANGCFLKVNENGATSPLPTTDPTGGWEVEESLDLDMVSAVCPNCNIILVEASTNNNTDLYASEDTAVNDCGASEVSNSWAGGEYSGEQNDEVHFNHPGVMITVSAGDNGYGPANAGYPTTSRYVTAVGGTTMNHVGSTWPQTAWSGTGSLCSQYIAQPAWQTALGSTYTSICSGRIANDVSADADPNTGVAVYDTFGGGNGCSTWCVVGGTSASSPMIAAVYALAGNGASLNAASYSYSHTSFLTDITSGSNVSNLSCGGTYLCTAGVGYDAPTGNGTPIGIGAF